MKAQTATAVVPDASSRQGDFSNRRNAAGQLTPIFDPFSARANPSFNVAGFLVAWGLWRKIRSF